MIRIELIITMKKWWSNLDHLKSFFCTFFKHKIVLNSKTKDDLNENENDLLSFSISFFLSSFSSSSLCFLGVCEITQTQRMKKKRKKKSDA